MARNSPWGRPIDRSCRRCKRSARASREISICESMGTLVPAAHPFVEVAGVLPGIILGQVVDGRAKVAATQRSAALAAATGEYHCDAVHPRSARPQRRRPQGANAPGRRWHVPSIALSVREIIDHPAHASGPGMLLRTPFGRRFGLTLGQRHAGSRPSDRHCSDRARMSALEKVAVCPRAPEYRSWDPCRWSG